ncbi:MerC domain-containing protein [Flammeovirga aprica]|uniref:MerC domain-containing protein n=1 Tax=Flammeovirga aprica JL-4 TaxID=694437 RepID=A0A7X9RXS2_9BACT|nr:MerC domain-containing protein [Flammeovirga aprica]NME70680.1 MerC domain-containing protein [Flammeovirga aprica JL-4]
MVKKLRHQISKYADQIGFTGSLFCLIHCILTSGVIVISSAVSHMDGHDHGHDHAHTLDLWGFLDISMILVGGIAVYFAVKKTKSDFLKNGMWLFYLIYASSMMMKYVGYEPLWLAIVSYAASTGLILSHLYNLKLTHTKQKEVCTC